MENYLGFFAYGSHSITFVKWQTAPIKRNAQL